MKVGDPITALWSPRLLLPFVVVSVDTFDICATPAGQHHNEHVFPVADEGKMWICGWHTPESEEGAALLATYALTRG